jgi:ABC-type sugar transport system ATPase subunit
MSAVELREISLRYDRDFVLSSLNLAVDSGEYIAILGASGCGKTSLLRMLAGLIQPTAGEIFLSGRKVNDLPPRDREVAYVPQSGGLYPHLRIRRSIEMGLRRKTDRSERRRRVEEAAALVGITELLDRFPERLSGGELRRAAVAKAVARRAKVRLLDEPLSAIDPSLRFQLEADLRTLHDASPGVTLHVTHDGPEALRLADRIAVVAGRRIMQFATPDKMVSDPSTPEVAAAIGTSPFRVYEVVRESGAWRDSSGRTITGPDAKVGTRAKFGFYADDLESSANGDEKRASDWHSPDGKLIVPAKSLRWFLPAAAEQQIGHPK